MTSVKYVVDEGVLQEVCSDLSLIWAGFGDILDYVDIEFRKEEWIEEIVTCLVTFDFSKKDYASLRTD